MSTQPTHAADDPGELALPYDPDQCPFTATLRVIGGKWRGVLWWRLSLGLGRFGQLQRSIPQISRKVLAHELRAMERDGVVARRAVPGTLPTVEYSLTELGRSLAPVVEAMGAWGGRALARGGGAAGVRPSRPAPRPGTRRRRGRT